MKLLFIDFEDSFTNNILSYLSHDFSLEVKNYRDVMREDFLDTNIILGPGPGHPEEYLNFFRSKGLNLAQLIQQTRRSLGICLGHQIILSEVFYAIIERSNFPMHGRGIRVLNSVNLLGIDLGEFVFQRYNSLTAVMNKATSNDHQIIYDENNEILITYLSERILTMQFHPESVGTSCSKSIFQAITSFFM